MKRIPLLLLVIVSVAAMALPVEAEDEEVAVGGSIQIRGNALTPGFVHQGGQKDQLVAFDKHNNHEYWTFERMLVNVNAQLSGGVRAFVELQSYDFWGIDEDDGDEESESFIANVRLGNYAGQGDDPIRLYRGFIEMGDICETPFMVRVGRQEPAHSREWLVGNNNAGGNFAGLAFDAVKGSYANDAFKIDAWWSQLADFSTPLSVVEYDESLEDSIDFVGVYGSYGGFDIMALDLYFLWVRNDADGPRAPQIFYAGVDNTDNLSTIGARLAGIWDLPNVGVIDDNLEGAYQFGDTAMGGDYTVWAFALSGYTLHPITWVPRIELEYAYFSRGDANDEDVGTFPRLFSNIYYGVLGLGCVLDNAMTNVHIFRARSFIHPADKWTSFADAEHYLLADDDGLVLGDGPSDGDDSVGLELDLGADYQYTEDLALTAGRAVFFSDDAVKQALGHDDTLNYLYVRALLTY